MSFSFSNYDSDSVRNPQDSSLSGAGDIYRIDAEKMDNFDQKL